MAVQKAEVDSISLIDKYRETGDISLRNELVLRHIGIVRYVAVSMRNMFSKFGDINDMINEGVLCLINAIETFNPEKGAKFETYATLKVRGGLIDYIRRQDWVPRAVRKFSRELDKAFSQLYTELNRQPTDEELAEKMGISLQKLQNFMAQSAAAVTLSLEELLYEDNFTKFEADDADYADTELLVKEQKKVILEAVESLNEREKQVITLYYYKKLKFADISQVLGVTESRISQIHTKAILILKSRLEGYYE